MRTATHRRRLTERRYSARSGCERRFDWKRRLGWERRFGGGQRRTVQGRLTVRGERDGRCDRCLQGARGRLRLRTFTRRATGTRRGGGWGGRCGARVTLGFGRRRELAPRGRRRVVRSDCGRDFEHAVGCVCSSGVSGDGFRRASRMLERQRFCRFGNANVRRVLRVFDRHPALNSDSPKRTLPSGRPTLSPGSSKTTAVEPR